VFSVHGRLVCRLIGVAPLLFGGSDSLRFAIFACRSKSRPSNRVGRALLVIRRLRSILIIRVRFVHASETIEFAAVRV